MYYLRDGEVDGIFQTPYRLEMNWKHCVVPTHLSVWPLSFYIQIRLLWPPTLIEIDKLTDGLEEQCGCRCKRVMWDMNRLKYRVTLLLMFWANSWASSALYIYLYIQKVLFLLKQPPGTSMKSSKLLLLIQLKATHNQYISIPLFLQPNILINMGRSDCSANMATHQFVFLACKTRIYRAPR